MRVFAKPTSLDRLSLEARILYSGFALFLLMGYATSAWLYLDDGLFASPNSAELYYLGDPSVRAEDAAKVHIDLPPGIEAAALRLEKPPRQVVETFHFHLFTVPVCLLIVGHLFMMCSLSTRTKSGIIAVASLSTLVHVLLPPLIRFASPVFAGLMFPSAILMALCFLYMTLHPVWEMWRPPKTLEA